MDSRGSWFDRYYRNVPPTRLFFYGIIGVFSLVTIVLLFTLIPSGADESQPMPEPAGRNILRTTPLIDGYNALPVELMDRLKGLVSKFPFDADLSFDNSTAYTWCRSDLPRFKNGLVSAQVFTMKASCDSQYKDAVSKNMQQIDAVRRLLSKYPSLVKVIVSSNDILTNEESGRLKAILGLDGGHAIDSKLSVLRTYYNLGVRYLTLTSECSTSWALSYKVVNSNTTTELSEFGKNVVKEMNRLGMIIDLGRSSKKTQLAVLNITQAPVIFTAVASQSVAPIVENIENEVLEQVKENNGLVMITFDAKLLAVNSTSARMKDVITHINYIRQVVGVDGVGLASGFHRENSFPVTSLNDTSKYPALFDRLAKPIKGEYKWDSDDLKKLAGLNFIRVWKSVEEISVKISAKETPNEALINPTDIPSNQRSCYSDL